MSNIRFATDSPTPFAHLIQLSTSGMKDEETVCRGLSVSPLGARLQIRIDDLRGPEIADLLAIHIAFCQASSPPESTHVLDLDALRAPGITFWSAWDGATLLGCAALKELDPAYGEVKSMHTAAPQRGRGVGLALLRQVVAEARSRGYRRLSLETGSMEAFAPARALYERFGFVGCPPFAGYRLDPNSVFMTLDLSGANPFPARDST